MSRPSVPKDEKAVTKLYKYHQEANYEGTDILQKQLLAKVEEYYTTEARIDSRIEVLKQQFPEKKLLGLLKQCLRKNNWVNIQDFKYDPPSQEEKSQEPKKLKTLKKDQLHAEVIRRLKILREKGKIDDKNKEDLNTFTNYQAALIEKAQLKKEHKLYNKGANIATASIVLYLKDPDQKSPESHNYVINIKHPDRDISSQKQTKKGNACLEQVSPYVGPIGPSSVNVLVYGHSEQDIMRHIYANLEQIKKDVHKVIKGKEDDYEALFAVATKRDTCCVCERSIGRMSQELTSALNITVNSSIIFSDTYDVDKVLEVINRVKKNHEDKITDFIKSAIGVDISDDDASYLIARLIELGISYSPTAKDNGVSSDSDSDSDEFDIKDESELARNLRSKDKENANIDFGFHILEEGDKIDLSEVRYNEVINGVKRFIKQHSKEDLEDELKKQLACKEHSHHRIFPQSNYQEANLADGARVSFAAPAAQEADDDIDDLFSTPPTTPQKPQKSQTSVLYPSPGVSGSVRSGDQNVHTPDENNKPQIQVKPTPLSSRLSQQGKKSHGRKLSYDSDSDTIKDLTPDFTASSGSDSEDSPSILSNSDGDVSLSSRESGVHSETYASTKSGGSSSLSESRSNSPTGSTSSNDSIVDRMRSASRSVAQEQMSKNSREFARSLGIDTNAREKAFSTDSSPKSSMSPKDDEKLKGKAKKLEKGDDGKGRS